MIPKFSRVTRSYQEAAKSYDRMSKYYNYISGPAETRLRQIGLELLNIRPGEKVLEIGFGTGTSLREIEKKTESSGIVIGVDISHGMCQVAADHLQTIQNLSIISVVQGNALMCPFPSGIFDVIFISFTLELFDNPDIPLLLQESSRLISNEGRIGIISLTKISPEPWMSTLYEKLHNRFPKYLDCRPIPVRELLCAADMNIITYEHASLFGLPVDIVIANWQ